MTFTMQEKLGSYSDAELPPLNDREVDARALLSCASGLRAAIDNQGQDMLFYGDAIRRNQRLWTLFQVALCEPDNQLPKNLKGILLNLSGYVDRVSFRAMSAYAPQLLNSLIDINRMIATGLQVRAVNEERKTEKQAAAPQSAPQPVVPGSVMISA